MAAIKWLAINLFIVGAAVIWLLFIPAADNASGVAHDSINGMRAGGDGSTRFPAVIAPAMLMYYGTLGAIAGLVMLALSNGKKSQQANLLVHGVSLVSVVVMLAIFLFYDRYLGSAEVAYVLGFPVPSTIAVYAVWSGGLLYSVIYVFGFDRFVYTTEQREGFETLLKELAIKPE